MDEANTKSVQTEDAHGGEASATNRKKKGAEARVAKLRYLLKCLARERLEGMALESDGRYSREEVERALRSAYMDDALVMATRASRYTAEDLAFPLYRGRRREGDDFDYARRVAERGGLKARRALVRLVEEARQGYGNLDHVSEGARIGVEYTVLDYSNVHRMGDGPEAGEDDLESLWDATARLQRRKEQRRADAA